MVVFSMKYKARSLTKRVWAWRKVCIERRMKERIPTNSEQGTS